MYDRVSQPNLKREKICKTIQDRPGSNFQGLLKWTGLGNGVLSFHLRRLEVEGDIRVKRRGRSTWFFPTHSDPARDWIIINLRKETCRDILVYLLNNESATFVEITGVVNKSPATISYTLKHLVSNNVVKKIPGFQKRYALYNYLLTKQLLDEMTITLIDSMTERFADSFSYY